MTLRTLPLQWNIPRVDVAKAPNLPDAALQKQVAAFQNTSLWSVMSTAVRSLHDHADARMTPALAHVQSVLKLPGTDDVKLALSTVNQLSQQAGKHTKTALDVLEGFGSVGLHKDPVFAPAVRDLCVELAKVVHGEDLRFVMEVAADVPGARKPMDAIGEALEPGLVTTLKAAENPRTALERGDQKRMMELVAHNQTVDYRGLIHDAALWGEWLGGDSTLPGAAFGAHKEMFPAYVYPHGAKHDPIAALLGDDGFVRGR